MAGRGRSRRKKAGKSKARQTTLKDANSDSADRSDQLAEELTALAAIFQDDFNLISEQPAVEFSINLRPHSIYDDDGEEYASIQLLVRCLPGYPVRPPKLRVLPIQGLTNEQLQYVHSMLVDQAASIAREGRVMIFDLFEAAQEFLSDQQRKNQCILEENYKEDSGNLPCTSSVEDDWQNAKPSPVHVAENQLLSNDSIYLDLFNEMWRDSDAQADENHVAVSAEHSNGTTGTASFHKQRKFWEDTRRSEPVQEDSEGAKTFVADESPLATDMKAPIVHPFQDEIAEFFDNYFARAADATNIGLSNGYSTFVSELVQQLHASLSSEGHDAQQCATSKVDSTDLGGYVGKVTFPMNLSKALQGSQLPEDLAIKTIQKDLVLGYLLRLACSPKGPLPWALPTLASELQTNGILSNWAKDLVASQPELFDATFRRMFLGLSKDMKLPPASQILTLPSAVNTFWSANPELLGEGMEASTPTSRYMSDFEEISLLGKGGFGYVVLCKNKLDGRRYAMKKIRLRRMSGVLNEKILREVATLARLQHHHVVRYYQAWIESGTEQLQLTLNRGLEDSESSRNTDATTDCDGASAQSTCLYIQMEYCPRTLRELFDSCTWSMDKDEIWRMFRQLVEGLVHIHGQGILHRDLNPNNIFFDSSGNIKIGDFGLAKFTNLEQSDRDIQPIDSSDIITVNFEGTGKVGTYFYTAPEMDQGLPHIDVKVDIYSLGVVLLEFWYPFATAMERFVILNDLKHKRFLPEIWSMEFADQAKLVRWLVEPNPADRPTAAQVLRSKLLPPRMENESLNDILRTLQQAEDTSVYDQVVAAIFDNERIISKAAHIDHDLAQANSFEKNKCLIKLVGSQNQQLEYVKEVFVRHGAHQIESSCLSIVDNIQYLNRQVANLLDSSGNLLQARYESRLSLARWIAMTQRLSLKSYNLSRVYRRGVGDNTPREYFQGDFDIIGGSQTLAEAETLKVAVEVLSKFPFWNAYDIRINHRQILKAIWSWTGVQSKDTQRVAQVLGVMSSAQPQSPARKSLWPFVRRQLLQGLHLPETVVDRLQTVERRLSGTAKEVLPRLLGALQPNETTAAAIEEISTLLRYLRIWGIDQFVLLDSLMAATEDFYVGFFFQVHVQKINNHNRNVLPAACIAVGGCYDQLITNHWGSRATNPAPGAVGLSIAVQRLIDTSSAERTEGGADVLVCSKGGGGLLAERMKIANELWSANIKAEYMCSEAPSLTEQYEYAHDNCIKWLVIITESALSLADTVKVRHLDLKVEEDVSKEELVKYFTDMTSQSLNLRKKAPSMRVTN